MHSSRIVLLCLVLLGICSCSPKEASVEMRTSDEHIVRELQAKHSQALTTKDLDALVALYADNGALYDEHNPIIRGKSRIRESWKSIFATPGLTLRASSNRVEVADAGDLAWAHGSMVLDAAVRPERRVFEYAVIYKKLPDAGWKIWADCSHADIHNSLIHTPLKSNSRYAPLAPLIGLGCFAGCLWFTFGMPIVTVICGCIAYSKRKWTNGLIVSLSMWIAFALVGGLMWLQISANYWNLPLRHAFIAAGDTARYGNPVEDTAESILISMIVISVFSGFVAGILARIGCWIRTRMIAAA